MNTKIIVGVVAGLMVGAGGGYWFGIQQAQSATATRGGAGGQSGTFVRGAGGARGGGAGAVFGTVIAKDASSITVQLGGPNATSTNGASTGTRIVLYDASTQVGKMVAGSASDLTVGESVVVQGSANSDGSLTAQSIQIRPAGSGPRGQ
jgi:hypothetical protein